MTSFSLTDKWTREVVELIPHTKLNHSQELSIITASIFSQHTHTHTEASVIIRHILLSDQCLTDYKKSKRPLSLTFINWIVSHHHMQLFQMHARNDRTQHPID